jgi:DNA-binding winged helix-turn-helix (wHTH) protein/tetratricopeptide (TPR) repeat protein
MPHTNTVYEFGPYRLNLAQRVLTRAGEIVSLTPKATEILRLLVINAGQLVEKDDLLKEVWPDTFVEESNLTQNIFTLRRALGDERTGPKYIETVARRGYRFVASVKVCETDAQEGSGADSERVRLSPGGEPHLVIAVLPFINATGDSALEYLAEGVTDNIINSLSRVSKLRVMARSAVFRHKRREFDPQVIGKELGAYAVLVGQLNSRPEGIAISAELVEVSNGWQLWGDSFDSDGTDLLQMQDAITRQLLVNLKLKLTGEEEKRVTARYTENAAAYQAYLEGRYHWSHYTRSGIEKAIGHFRQAIELDPNYALAYAGIVDCYLRLATNYLPPEEDAASLGNAVSLGNETSSDSKTSFDSKVRFDEQSNARVKLRFEWDWKAVERERRRANELNADYPSPHQWYVAYQLSEQLYRYSLSGKSKSESLKNWHQTSKRASQIPSLQLTPTEEIQILCAVARDQMAVGNYEAAKLILLDWFVPGKWPKLGPLNGFAAADLLFTCGSLSGWIAGSGQVVHGHKHAEALLNGSVALFEQLGIKSRSVEARVELARGYYQQGLFDSAYETISTALSEVPDDHLEVKIAGLVVWGQIERELGRLRASLVRLREAAATEAAGQLITGRCNLDLATTLKDVAISEREEAHFHEAKLHFLRALYESEALGSHRNAAVVENNMGFLLLSIGAHEESERHLLRSRRLFTALSDSVRTAQVNETLARLYIETERYTLAHDVINQAVSVLELTDNEAILSEALTTSGIVACRLGNFTDGKARFESAHNVAQRCEDSQGASRALLSMLEEMGNRLEIKETFKMADQLNKLLAATEQISLRLRMEQAIFKSTTMRRA